MQAKLAAELQIGRQQEARCAAEAPVYARHYRAPAAMHNMFNPVRQVALPVFRACTQLTCSRKALTAVCLEHGMPWCTFRMYHGDNSDRQNM